MKRFIKAAGEASGNEKLQNMMDKISDDFDFIIEGLGCLERRGAEASNEALIIAERFSSSIEEIINEIGSKIGE